MVAILVFFCMDELGFLPFNQEISSITVGDLPATFSYDKAEPSLAEISEDERLADNTSEVHYFNRWTKRLEEQRSRREIHIDIPESAIKPLFTNSFVKEPNHDASKSSDFEVMLIRIEYEIVGSYQGLQFVKTIAKDGQSLDVLANSPSISILFSFSISN